MRRRAVVQWTLVCGGLVALAGAAAWVWLAPGWAEDAPVINITYPYRASPERKRQIRAGFPRVAPGSSMTDVTDVLGEPDEVRPLYEPVMFRPRRIGTTYWYFLAKSAADSNNGIRGVRVSFDTGGRLTGIDRWGLD